MTNSNLMTLQNWKKPPKLDSRVSVPDANEALGIIIAATNDKEIKELLLKIKTNESYENNSKAILSFEVKILCDTLTHLGGVSQGLIKEGLSYRILHRLYALMPNHCESCIRTITSSSESRDIFCAGCGTSICGNCNKGNQAVCIDCLVWVHERYNNPEIFYSKNYIKRQQKESISNRNYESLMDETDTDFTQRFIPAGQGQNMESTVLEATLVGNNVKNSDNVNNGDIGSDMDDPNDDDDSFTTVRNKKEEKKMRQKEKKEEKKKLDEIEKLKSEIERLKKTDGDKKSESKNCEYFLKGCCRHGFKGKTPRGNNKECRFIHPTICKPYINQGNEGCNKGKKCDQVHPTLCKHSRDTRKCPNMKEGKRCREGYHLLNTVGDTGEQIPATSTTTVRNSTHANVGISAGNETVKDFLSVLIKQQIQCAMAELYPKTPPSPAVTPPAPVSPVIKEKEQTGQDYLWALLGKKLLSNV